MEGIGNKSIIFSKMTASVVKRGVVKRKGLRIIDIFLPLHDHDEEDSPCLTRTFEFDIVGEGEPDCDRQYRSDRKFAPRHRNRQFPEEGPRAEQLSAESILTG